MLNRLLSKERRYCENIFHRVDTEKSSDNRASREKATCRRVKGKFAGKKGAFCRRRRGDGRESRISRPTTTRRQRTDNRCNAR